MPWLVRDTRVIASLEIVDTPAGRRRGLLGRNGIEGAMLLRRTRSVHTMRMCFAIDVAHLDRNLTVLSITTMQPGRIGRWHRRADCVLEAEAGSFRAWGVQTGDLLEIKE